MIRRLNIGGTHLLESEWVYISVPSLFLSVCVYRCVYVCVYQYICACVSTSVCMCVSASVCMCVSANVCIMCVFKILAKT